ncbi:unnamed protein product [Paramecium sonneborni]|uniref:Uncharacterized protein n=1 Tax=Paramecium sonneborni TaxID=65129 RepID=A0A8S1QZF7_9CILI|nr:unnamed protein product [Paramecium sonneborni]
MKKFARMNICQNLLIKVYKRTYIYDILKQIDEEREYEEQLRI